MLYSSSLRPQQIDMETIKPVSCINDTVFVYYDNKIYNLNKQFGLSLSNCKYVKIVTYKQVYFGLRWNVPLDISLLSQQEQDNYEQSLKPIRPTPTLAPIKD